MQVAAGSARQAEDARAAVVGAAGARVAVAVAVAEAEMIRVTRQHEAVVAAVATVEVQVVAVSHLHVLVQGLGLVRVLVNLNRAHLAPKARVPKHGVTAVRLYRAGCHQNAELAFQQRPI